MSLREKNHLLDFKMLKYRFITYTPSLDWVYLIPLLNAQVQIVCWISEFLDASNFRLEVL